MNCATCGTPLTAERLTANPNANQCVPCLTEEGDVPVQQPRESRVYRRDPLCFQAALYEEKPPNYINTASFLNEIHELAELPTNEFVMARKTGRDTWLQEQLS